MGRRSRFSHLLAAIILGSACLLRTRADGMRLLCIMRKMHPAGLSERSGRTHWAYSPITADGALEAGIISALRLLYHVGRENQSDKTAKWRLGPNTRIYSGCSKAENSHRKTKSRASGFCLLPIVFTSQDLPTHRLAFWAFPP